MENLTYKSLREKARARENERIKEKQIEIVCGKRVELEKRTKKTRVGGLDENSAAVEEIERRRKE